MGFEVFTGEKSGCDKRTGRGIDVEKTVKERILAKLIQMTKKHRIFQYPAMVCATIVLLVCGIIDYFRNNGLRYACLFMSMLFFTLSSSFSFQTTATQVADPTFSDAELAQAEQMEAMPVLDDKDVLDGYENTELDNMEAVDTFSVDEILEENHIEENEALTEDGVKADEATQVHFDKDDWRLVLINKQHPIPEGYTFELGTIKGSMKCDARILEDLFAMLQAAKKDGMNLVICSPYRDLNRQQVLFERKIKNYMSRGMTYMNSYKLASQAVTVPGASEHQLGLALDIVSGSYTSLTEGFGDTAEGKWLAEHSCEYGFILRYPLGKEYITSIEYEPWHFRYVGREAAMVITENGMTLEEFVDSL